MRPHGWIALLLLAATLAVFYQVRGHEFVGYDDYVYVVQNANLRDGLSPAALARAFRPYEVNWIPLTWISLQVDYALYGLEPAGYHLTNLALHALSAILLHLALVSMTGAVWRSAFVAAVFALHPLHVESVAWITERKDTLSGVFWMLTLCAYARYCRQPGSIRSYLLVLLCLALGLMAKPMLVTLPFVLLLLDYWPLDRLREPGPGAWPAADKLRAALVEKLPMLALVAAASAVTFVVQSGSGGVSALDALPLGLRIENALVSYAVYVWKAVWPSGLAAFYPHPLTSIADWRVAAASAFLVGATLAAARAAPARPYAIVGWLWYLGALVPVIGLVQVGMQARADRYMYLPLIGLSIVVAWGAFDLAERWRIPRAAIGAMAATALAALAVTAWYQVETWRSTEALYRHALSVTDRNYIAHKGLGYALTLQKRFDEAASHFAEAARLAPDWPEPRLGLADIAAARGRLEEALRGYREELRIDPYSIEAAVRYGLALGMAGRYAEARPYLLRALAVHPGKVELHLAMAIFEAALGRPRESVRYGREVLRLSPNNVEGANNLAWTLATCSDPTVRNPQEAIRVIETIALESGDPWVLDTLAAAYAAAGRFEAAVSTASRAADRAERMGGEGNASEIRARLSLYSRGKPFVDRGSKGGNG
jgi:tetratricopeptide (TPR) repeat protein